MDDIVIPSGTPTNPRTQQCHLKKEELGSGQNINADQGSTSIKSGLPLLVSLPSFAYFLKVFSKFD
jgi:hypothetical protein